MSKNVTQTERKEKEKVGQKLLAMPINTFIFPQGLPSTGLHL